MKQTEYNKVHSLLAHKRGRAVEHLCACEKQACDWAYQYTGETKVDEYGREYSLDLDDYSPMCRSCHFRMDNKKSPRRAEAHKKSMESWRSTEAKAKIRAKVKGRKRPPETVKKIREAWTPELREKHSEISKRAWTPERRASHSAKVRAAWEKKRIS